MFTVLVSPPSVERDLHCHRNLSHPFRATGTLPPPRHAQGDFSHPRSKMLLDLYVHSFFLAGIMIGFSLPQPVACQALQGVENRG